MTPEEKLFVFDQFESESNTVKGTAEELGRAYSTIAKLVAKFKSGIVTRASLVAAMQN